MTIATLSVERRSAPTTSILISETNRETIGNHSNVISGQPISGDEQSSNDNFENNQRNRNNRDAIGVMMQ